MGREAVRQGSRALFSGSFDPPTLGHCEVIRRAQAVFPELVIGIGVNPEKTSFLAVEERRRLLEAIVRPYPTTKVVTYTGLTADFALRHGVSVLVRGLRHEGDLALEKELASGNERLALAASGRELVTVFFLAAGPFAEISSRLVREIIRGGGVEAALPFLPEAVHEPLKSLLGER